MRRFAWFDCLRFVAIFIVMVTHSGFNSSLLPGGWAKATGRFQEFGWCGVDLFFVLSGFLVSGLLFDEHDLTGRLDIRRFLIRRAFKIIPAFYVMVAISLIYQQVIGHPFNGTHLLHDVFFLQSYRAGMWSHAWTLAVEVHFYILLALLLAWLASSRRDWLKRLPGILGAVLVAILLARLVNWSVRTGNFNYHKDIEPTHLHLDVLAAGVLLRYLYTYHRSALVILDRGRILWVALAIVLVSRSAYIWHPHSEWSTAFVPTLNYLGFGLIVFQATQLPFPTAGVGRWLVAPFDYLGKHSYGIYLWHLPVMQWLVLPLVPERGPLNFFFFFAASFAVGVFFSEALEMPVLHLRNRLFPSTLAAGRRPSQAVQKAA